MAVAIPRTLAFTFLAALAFASTGCAEAPHPAAMTVSPAAVAAPLGPSLKVMPVAGGKKTEGWDTSHLGNAEFQDALLSSLKNSRLFQSVAMTGPADWLLRTTIVSQEMRGLYHNTAEMMVRYDISDTSGRGLWGDTVYSSAELGVGDIFSGAERKRVVIENAARGNLSKLLKRLQQWLNTRAHAAQGGN